jgi:hypothetical protein
VRVNFKRFKTEQKNFWQPFFRQLELIHRLEGLSDRGKTSAIKKQERAQLKFSTGAVLADKRPLGAEAEPKQALQSVLQRLLLDLRGLGRAPFRVEGEYFRRLDF